MSLTQYESYTEWKILPITSIKFLFTNNEYSFMKLVKGSAFSFKPIPAKAKTTRGFEKTIGWSVQVVCIPLQNNLGDMQPFLEDADTTALQGIHISLIQDSFASIFQDIELSALLVRDFSIKYEINYKDEIMGPELTITASGKLSKEAVTSSNFQYIFSQGW